MKRLPSVGCMSAFSAILLSAAALMAQSTGASASPKTTVQPQRDPAAITVIQNAVAALGGNGNIAAVHDCRASGTFTSPSDTWLRFTSFVWENAGNQYSYEVMDPKGLKSIDRSGHGKPSIEIDGKRRPRFDNSPISASPAHLVSLRLLQLLEDPRLDLMYDGATALNGSQVLKIRTRYNLNQLEASLTQQEWYFDQNYQPVRVEYQVGDDHDAASITKLAADLAAYAPVNGVLVPMQITFWMDGKVGATATITDIHFNSAINSSDFD